MLLAQTVATPWCAFPQMNRVTVLKKRGRNGDLCYSIAIKHSFNNLKRNSYYEMNCNAVQIVTKSNKNIYLYIYCASWYDCVAFVADKYELKSN
ncbi:MAG TPA: hypothetical protein PLI53_00425 [Geobacteraceae bacterium]|nr:hypothetical protein [Geobacteraceae bacterium]